jgi:hypothetical protein
VAKNACVDQMDKLSSITSSNSGHSRRALMRKWFPRYIPTYSTLLCAKLWVFVILHAGCPRISSVHLQLSALSLTHTVHVGILHIWAPFSTWTMGVQNSFNIIENCSAMYILCIAEHMYLVLKISIRAYGISRLKLGVVWMLLHNYTIKSISGCRKF